MKMRHLIATAVLAGGVLLPATAGATDIKLQRLVLQASTRGAQIGRCGTSESCQTSGVNRVLSIDSAMVDHATVIWPTATAQCRYWLRKVDDRPVLLAATRFFNSGTVGAADDWGRLQHTLLVRALRAATVC